MFDRETIRFSLPDDEYLWLLGASLCAFDSNCGLVIEGILKVSPDDTWSELVNRSSGRLGSAVSRTITVEAGDEIAGLFSELVWRRNRIIHAFRITSDGGDQILATKDKKTQEQFHITKNYLRDFIRLNEELNDMLERFRTSAGQTIGNDA